MRHVATDLFHVEGRNFLVMVDYQHALYLWRNMPRTDGVSPAELLFNRQQIINTPMTEEHHQRHGEHKVRDKKHEQNKVTYNLRSTRKTCLKEGEAIRIQDPKTQKWNITGKVKEVRSDHRIIIKEDNGKEALRERRHIEEL